MEPTDVLATVAELAVAFAGFSGIVAALGRRDEGAIFPEDRVRISVLVGASLSTLAFALLPFALWDVAGSPARVWSIASALYVPYGLAILFVSERDARRAVAEDRDVLRRVSPLPQRFSTYIGFPVVIGLQLANVFTWGSFTPFLVALLWGLVGCAIGFAGLVRALHR
jgi:hypothetical protein